MEQRPGGIERNIPHYQPREDVAPGQKFDPRTGRPYGHDVRLQNYDGMNSLLGGSGVNATGNVNLNIVSNGTAARVAAKTDGMFQPPKIKQHRQMQPTETPA